MDLCTIFQHSNNVGTNRKINKKLWNSSSCESNERTWALFKCTSKFCKKCTITAILMSGCLISIPILRELLRNFHSGPIFRIQPPSGNGWEILFATPYWYRSIGEQLATLSMMFYWWLVIPKYNFWTSTRSEKRISSSKRVMNGKQQNMATDLLYLFFHSLCTCA